ncbi:hypothetical protein EXIGLDRAFT_829999 [Exidia glandulosa HHB12029]|uniref:Protein kinase domain-containing protein n=1 Tax=Exidia glandulosa HHB12029 TaxID=1314781 RepID=A0A165P207_EXIGL|nr:hypothetical protein EXIGLDRAFT_829999 [Exidia glandulosa HHB12029]
MSKCQGSTLPYFFGAHKSTAPSGEPIDIMAFEYLHGPSMMAYRDNLNDDALFAKWKEWDNYRLLAASFVKTLKMAHECKIIHRDLHESNLIIDEENSRIVVIDWELCVIDGEKHEFWEKQELMGVQHMVQRYAGNKYQEAVLEVVKSSRPL